MNITTEQVYTVFKNEFNGYAFYKIGISKKSKTGEWINGYIRCQFKNGVVVDNKTKIKIKKSWLSFYNKDKETIPYIFVNEFEFLNQETNNTTQVTNNITPVEPVPQEEADPFKDFAEEVVITDDMLPF